MLMGQRLGSFQLEKELGSGAMGTVYRARNAKTGQRAAIKVLTFGLGTNKKALERFEREAEVLKQLNHPNIVRFIAHGRFQGTQYVAMEFIDGETLDNVLQRRNRLTWEEVVEIGRQICEALQHAHDRGIVHRDLKPSNLMITTDNVVKLTDFGIAKDLDMTQLTSAQCTVGTAAYMSPEQCRGEKHLTHRSDLYALGVVLYELLTGDKPFKAETPMDMFMQHAHGAFERPARRVLETPVWLDNLICQLLEKEPEKRAYDATAVSHALGHVVEKVSAQQSAGVDAARTHAIDRARDPTRIPDDTDKQAARTLLTSLHPRRKKRQKAFYQKTWFQAAALSALLLLVAGTLYLILKPASAERLHEQTMALWNSTDPDGRSKARDGPIEDFLRRFPDRNDALGQEMNRWADEYDRADLIRVWNNRRNNPLGGRADNDAEQHYREAMLAESAGNLVRAQKEWAAVEQGRGEDERKTRVGRLIATERRKQLDAALHLEQQLRELVKNPRPQSDLEKRGVEAIRFEDFGDLPAARQRWQLVLTATPDRVWGLLAEMKARLFQPDLKRPTTAAKVKEARLDLLRQKLRKAEEVKAKNPAEARNLCRTIVELYRNDADADVADCAKEAEALFSKIKGT